MLLLRLLAYIGCYCHHFCCCYNNHQKKVALVPTYFEHMTFKPHIKSNQSKAKSKFQRLQLYHIFFSFAGGANLSASCIKESTLCTHFILVLIKTFSECILDHMHVHKFFKFIPLLLIFFSFSFPWPTMGEKEFLLLSSLD